MALGDIETFIIVMLENRSFDHACGYLSLPDADPPLVLEGLRNDPTWLGTFDNDDHDGTPKRITALTHRSKILPTHPTKTTISTPN